MTIHIAAEFRGISAQSRDHSIYRKMSAASGVGCEVGSRKLSAISTIGVWHASADDNLGSDELLTSSSSLCECGCRRSLGGERVAGLFGQDGVLSSQLCNAEEAYCQAVGGDEV